MTGLNTLFTEMSGQKFRFEPGLSKYVWETLLEDTNWFCRESSLPEYQFVDEDLKPDADIWCRRTRDYLKNVLPQLQSKDRKTILRELLFNSTGKQDKMHVSKRFILFIFVLTYLKAII